MKIKLVIMALLTLFASLACAFDEDFSPFDFSFKFSGQRCIDRIPGLFLNMSSYAFGNQSTGTTRSTNIALTNSGNAALTDIVFQPFSSAVFAHSSSATSPCGTTLAAKSTCYRKVSFTPTAAAAYSDSLVVSSNQLDDVTVPVSGTGTETISGYTDAFAYDDGSLPTLNSTWVTNTGATVNNPISVASGQVKGSTNAVTNTAIYNVAINNDQFSQIAVMAGVWTGAVYPFIRTSKTAGSFYLVRFESATTIRICKYASGSITALGTAITVPTYASGAVLKISAVGTTLTGCSGTTCGTVTDSTFSAGYAGFGIYANTYTGDNWMGGNL